MNKPLAYVAHKDDDALIERFTDACFDGQSEGTSWSSVYQNMTSLVEQLRTIPAEVNATQGKIVMTGKVTESIFSGSSVIVPLADVQHIERHDKNSIPGIMVVTCHTKYNFDRDGWENAIWISDPEATTFRSAWCRYRSELEAGTLADLSPAS